jgi:hypothetical protein
MRLNSFEKAAVGVGLAMVAVYSVGSAKTKADSPQASASDLKREPSSEPTPPGTEAPAISQPDEKPQIETPEPQQETPMVKASAVEAPTPEVSNEAPPEAKPQHSPIMAIGIPSTPEDEKILIPPRHPLKDNAEVSSSFASTKLPKSDRIGFRPHGSFQFMPFTEYSRIDSLDRASQADAVFYSNLNAGLDFKWAFYKSERVSFLAGFRISKFSVYDFDNGVGLTNNAETRAKYSAGAFYNFTDYFRLGAMLSYADEIYNRAISASSIVLDKIAAPGFSSLADLRLLRVNRFSMGLSGESGVDLPTQTGPYRTSLLYFGEVGAWLKQEFSAFDVKGGFSIEKKKLESNLTEQTETNLRFNVRLDWNFDG